MTLELLQQNWALAVAAALLSVVAVIVALSLRRRSSGGQLGARVGDLKAARRERRAAERRLAGKQRTVARLERDADRVRPRDLDETRGRLQDAEALLKIARDRELVAANLLRQVIYEEFPPARHEALRRRYLPDDAAAARPLSS